MSEKKEGTDNPVEANAESGKEYQKGVLDAFWAMFKADKAEGKAEMPTKEAEKSVKSDAMVVSEVVTLEEIMLKIHVVDAKLDQLLGSKVENLTLDSIDSAENKAETEKPAETEQKEASKEVETEAKNDAKEVHTWLPANTWAGSENNENTLEAMQAKLKGVK